ncbi:MAG: ATP-binding protein [Spirochaetes bacterium]|nr:ATP-binding protein [Spirochaetota bacterium]
MDVRSRYKKYHNLYIKLIESITSLQIDIEQLLPIVALVLCEVGYADRSAVILFDEDQQYGNIITGFHILKEQFHSDSDQQIELKNYPEIVEVINNQNILMLNSKEELLKYLPSVEVTKKDQNKYSLSSVLITPLIHHNKIIGIIRIDKLDSDENFAEDDELFCKIICDYLSTRIDVDTKSNLEKEKYLIENLLNSMLDTLIILNSDQTIQMVNAATEILLGYQSAELIGKNLSQIIDDSELLEAITNSEITEQMETYYLSKDGQIIPVLLSVSIMWDDDGENQGIICVAKDITNIKDLEKKLLQTQKMEAIGNLAGGIAHDFNNILTIIRSYNEIIHTSVQTHPEIARNVEEVIAAVDKASALTRQLLAFSRKQILQKKVINLNEIIENHLTMLKRLIGEDVELVTYLDSQLENIKVDPIQLEQVIMNLLVNARDAMPQGGQISLKTEMCEIDEKTSRLILDAVPGNFVHLVVKDDGVGITEENLPCIFDPFFTTKTKEKGSGLGLSVVYGIVKQHDGWITVNSKANKGTTIHIYLPAVGHEEHKGDNKVFNPIAFSGSGERVLIIEDDQELLKLTERILKTKGFSVYPASNAASAKQVFSEQNQQFDIVLIDAVLPDSTGLKLIDEFQEAKPDLKVILCSGYLDEKIQWSLIQEKKIPFLQKPFSINDIMSIFKDILDK